MFAKDLHKTFEKYLSDNAINAISKKKKSKRLQNPKNKITEGPNEQLGHQKRVFR